MNTTSGNVAQFTTVDRALDSAWFIDFMDLANAIPEYADIRARLAANLAATQDSVLLDVGCGTGDDARELAAMLGQGGRVVGTDLSEVMVEEARRRSAGSDLPVEFQVADVRQLDFPDASFDGVRAKLVLMHCAGIDTAAAELIRVVRPGGRITVFDYDFDTTTIDHPDKAATREVVRCLSDGHPNNWSGRQLRRRFLNLDLSDVSVTPHTVMLPYSFFRMSVFGKLAAAQEEGALALSAAALEDWWKALTEAEENELFFTSLTGFLLGGTR